MTRHLAHVAHILLTVSLGVGALTSCHPSRQDSASPHTQAAVAQLQHGVPTVVTRRADGVILVNGQPFFPIGFYHVSWARSGTPERRQQDLARLARAGFNIMITEPINDVDAANFQFLLKQAQEAGVYIVPYHMTPENRQKISAHPAILGFKIADDAHELTPSQVIVRRDESKRAVPQKLTYISLSVARDRLETPFFGTADVVGSQSYPIGNDDIGVTYQVMRNAVLSARQKGTVPIANLQSFLWGRRKPSPLELRNMTYQALMAGMKGVVYYAYRAREVDLNREPVMWSTLQNVAREINFLSPYLLNGEIIPIQDGTRTQPLAVYLRGESPEGQMKAFILTLNNSRTADQRVNLQLPEPATQWKSLYTQGRPLSRNGQNVSGLLLPLQVAIYEVR